MILPSMMMMMIWCFTPLSTFKLTCQQRGDNEKLYKVLFNHALNSPSNGIRARDHMINDWECYPPRHSHFCLASDKLLLTICGLMAMAACLITPMFGRFVGTEICQTTIYRHYQHYYTENSLLEGSLFVCLC